ncbi:transglutaminase-like domain-containing protein [Paraflavisolibacter sp. H34]|uniref:transglutaminase-like domain-containing protein n=1 Tax=Huijunlia imazamoxiresistens TaxID=3127457 RepID=UPI00301B5D29
MSNSRIFLFSILLTGMYLTSCKKDVIGEPQANNDVPGKANQTADNAKPLKTALNFNHAVHLVGRHPEIVKDPRYKKWNLEHGSQIWHETRPDADGNYSVIIQSPDKNDIIAFRLKRAEGLEEQPNLRPGILAVKAFDVVREKSLKAHALEAARSRFTKESILAERPVVNWESNTLSWEIEAKEGNQIRKVSTDHQETLTPFVPFPITAANEPSLARQRKNDWLEENDLHHLNHYYTTAINWAKGGKKVSDKAYRIWLKVREKMLYDANITNILEFTWADKLVIGNLGYRGVCDEWSVVTITMLRALGIPAVMKFMTFNYYGSYVGHACVEWSDKGTWKHMDPLWNAFDNPAVYRQNGATELTVMDANFPKDSKYTGFAWGVPDISGDGKLYPYGDFTISPAYPGNSRKGYSY